MGKKESFVYWFISQMSAMASTGQVEARSFTQVSHMSGRDQALGPSSATMLGALAGAG